QQPLEEISTRFGIPYRVSGLDADKVGGAEIYDFEIHADVNSPIDPYLLATVVDRSPLITQFTLTTNPVAAQPASPAAPGATAAAPGGATPAPGAAAPAGGTAAPAGGAR